MPTESPKKSNIDPLHEIAVEYACMTKSFLREVATMLVFFVIGTVTYTGGLWIWGTWHDEWSGYNKSLSMSDGICNIAVISVVGSIISYRGADENGSGNTLPPSTNVSDTLFAIGRAEADPHIKGILARIDSPGGSPASSEMISKGFKETTLPVAAFITDIGASGAYLIATGAKTIIASPFSNVGSIGVTMSYLENSQRDASNGVKYVSLSTGKFKDSGSPDKPLTDEERALFERDLSINHEQFVKEVSENRNIPLEDVKKLADGSTMPGSLALEHKLIDAVGDKETVRDWFAGKLGIAREKVVFCQ